MKRFLLLIALIGVFLFSGIQQINAQGRFLRKLKNEAENKAIEKIFNKEEEEAEAEKSESENYDDEYSTNRNRKGGGLSQNIPDVEQAITDAGNSFSSGDYKRSKSHLRDAIWGVELGIGNSVLEALPEQISSLSAQKDNDRVSSSGMGFAGMIIGRVYTNDDEMEFVVNIGNDAAILGVASIMASGEAYRDSQENPNQKQIRFQEQSAVIEYDDYSGYTLTAPFGQTSILVLKGVNFETEDEFMAAANKIDLFEIKQKLGDQ